MIGSVFLLVGAALAVALYLFERAGGETIAVSVPTLSESARVGQVAFTEHCSQCHGTSGGGTSQGPPLVDRIYEPAHHDDRSIRAAIAFGVRQHHWRFGDMPAQRQVARDEAGTIVTFVREVQRANGIF